MNQLHKYLARGDPMNSKKIPQIIFQMLIVISLLVATTSSVSAQGEDYIGQVSASASKSLPFPKTILITPLASQPLPGGGTATATAQLAWTASRMDGTAKSMGNFCQILPRIDNLVSII